MKNIFYAGNNFDGLSVLKRTGLEVNLVYIDPPFATGQDFLMNGHRANSISSSGTLAYTDTATGEDYLETLHSQLDLIKQVMAPNASIYVHIGVNVEHHVRLLMDSVFGKRHFRNSITRVKCNPKNFPRLSYGNVKDTILFYSHSSNDMTWNPQRQPYTELELLKLYPRVDSEGRRYTTTPLHAPGTTKNGATGSAWRGMYPPEGRHWRVPPARLDELDGLGLIAWSKTGNPRLIKYADEAEGKLPQDIWYYKDPANPMYPTQKNAEMLRRIILTSSHPDDVILDCFAGSGEALIQAHSLGRRFVGMDSSEWSHQVIQERMSHVDKEWIIADGVPGLRDIRTSRKQAQSTGNARRDISQGFTPSQARQTLFAEV
ncbi:MAG: site-specific DNA-methyltransferase [Gammaproteobacteria bacterium]|nr:site-specific DNA-methyltransferase [Gammaproteobacteria bacterium]